MLKHLKAGIRKKLIPAFSFAKGAAMTGKYITDYRPLAPHRAREPTRKD